MKILIKEKSKKEIEDEKKQEQKENEEFRKLYEDHEEGS